MAFVSEELLQGEVGLVKIIPGRETEYQQYVALNSTDPYSKAVVEYAEAWAALMENALTDGQTLPGCWKHLSREADTDGITGFMYGAATQALAHFWVHGDELRQLHNADYGVTEDRAQGGTVNPAIFELPG